MFFSSNRYAAVLAVSILSSAAVCMPNLGQAAVHVVVNHEAGISIGDNGSFSYRSTASGTALQVRASGPILCANAGTPLTGTTTLAPKYSNSEWQLPIARDVRHIGYGGERGGLVINQRVVEGQVSVVDSSLSCHPVDAGGHPPTPYAGGIFRSAFDDKSFDNTLPENDTAEILTVYVAGVTSCGTQGSDCILTQRYMSANVDTLAYAFRFHADSPLANALTIPVSVRDAFHGHFLSSAGQYCLLTELSAQADLSTACEGANVTVPLTPLPAVAVDSENGNLKIDFTLNPSRPSIDRYVVVRRPIVADSGVGPRLLIGVSIFTDPLYVTDPHSGEGIRTGDLFVGDDVMFGCYPVGNCAQRFGGP